jgi:anthranilate phosphoribosyltransferase
VLLDLGTERALIVHGNGGMDELSTIGETRISEIKNGNITTYAFNHSEAGIPASELASVAGGDAVENAVIIRSVLNGTPGGPKDIVVLNAGAAVYVSGIAGSITEGVQMADAVIHDGRAIQKLNDLIEFTNA